MPNLPHLPKKSIQKVKTLPVLEHSSTVPDSATTPVCVLPSGAASLLTFVLCPETMPIDLKERTRLAILLKCFDLRFPFLSVGQQPFMAVASEV